MASAEHDRDELVELMSRYAAVPDTGDWDDLPPSVFCDEIAFDFSALGVPAGTMDRSDWCRRTKLAFAGWTATHHSVTNHRISVEGDYATIRAHVRVEHWAPPEVGRSGSNCWLVVGFYENTAVRTANGWRLNSVKLTVTHQENEALLAATTGRRG